MRTIRGFIKYAIVCGLLCGRYGFADSGKVLVEAEAFNQRGGWVVDQQYMDVMGSPFLMAHGLGNPVEDAQTTVQLPSPGTYRVWVRTRDWVAPWKTPDTPETKRAYGTPGQFQVKINGALLQPVFGTKGSEWHWQDGGVASIPGPAVDLALHDLTGFHGRCDVILLTSDLQYIPPDDAPAAWRRTLLGIPEEPESAGEYDLVVCGGGSSGLATAISAARLGVKVALIHNRPVLGGNASSEARVGYTGRGLYEPYPKIGRLTEELQWSRKEMHPGKRYPKTSLEDVVRIEDARRQSLVEAEPNITLFLNYHINEVKTGGDHAIQSVTAVHIETSRRLQFKGIWFADCTGDGNVGFLAGAKYEMSLPRMGRSNLFGVRRTQEVQTFAPVPWALNLYDKPFPGRSDAPPEGVSASHNQIGGWYWESGFNHDYFEKGEYIRDWNFRARYGSWDVIKNVEKTREKDAIGWLCYISGTRESRRLIGDVILSEEDILGGKKYEDGCVPMNWRLDVHIPDPIWAKGFEGDEFIATSPKEGTTYKAPYWMPYRSLYSVNVPNLFMAGRCASTTRIALGATRVQWTTSMMGEIVGMAASICKKNNVNPRGVYESHLPELFELMKQGVGREENVPPPPASGVPEPVVSADGESLLLVQDDFSSQNPAWAFSGPAGSKAEIAGGALTLTVSDRSSLSSAAYLPFRTIELKDGQILQLRVEVSTATKGERAADIRMGLGFSDPVVAPGSDSKAGVSGYFTGAPSGKGRSIHYRRHDASREKSDFLYGVTETLGGGLNRAFVSSEPTEWIFEISRSGDRLSFSGGLAGEMFPGGVFAEGDQVIPDFRFNTIALGYLYSRGQSCTFHNVSLELIHP